MNYYSVTHRYTKENFATVAKSKSFLKKILSRVDESGGYSSFWTIVQIDEDEYQSLMKEGVSSEIPDHYKAKP